MLSSLLLSTMKTFALTTRFKDRLSHLEKTASSWCSIKEFSHFIVVDWGSVEDCIPLISSLKDDRFVVLRTSNKGCEGYFDRGRAHNASIFYTDCDFICTVDCDVRLKSGFRDIMRSADENTVLVKKDEADQDLTGLSVFNKSVWGRVGGYREHLPGWGYEDDDFYKRCARAGYRLNKVIDDNCACHLSHSDALRLKYNRYKTFSRLESLAENYKHSFDKITHKPVRVNVFSGGFWTGYIYV